jgi:hypothetical protein
MVFIGHVCYLPRELSSIDGHRNSSNYSDCDDGPFPEVVFHGPFSEEKPVATRAKSSSRIAVSSPLTNPELVEHGNAMRGQ